MTTASLTAADLSVEFSGLRALDRVSITLNTGEILGLIGPNGSGKTTLVNALTGHVRALEGTITCAGETITHLKPFQIARKGVARSFQIVRLFRNLTVLENVETAAIVRGASRPAARRRGLALLEDLGLAALAEEPAGALSYGDERRVEIARALAAEPRFLLLDEPAAGMNEAEGHALVAMLSALPAARNLGLLVIDHHMPLIMRLCQRLHVLASGRTIGEGDVETVRRLPAVIEAYLGVSAVEAADA
ncbi:MAG: ABC transporter ATP-binding protein [Rhodospirillaceae bacterium]|nr:ABC transporter ATP-binding protein [Rhodospirillaceae bacterium]